MSKNSWTIDEFKDVSFGDKRINNRFIHLSKELASKPLSPINKASDDWKACKAAYRFFDNEKVTSDKILNPHIRNTIKRCQNYPFILAIQDTSSFNYTDHNSKKDLGTIGNGSKEDGAQNSKGFYIHPTLAVAPNGLPLGVLDTSFWKRNENEDKSNHDEKESVRWCSSVERCHELCHEKVKFISIADRECDFNEFYLTTLDTDNHFIVRSRSSRKILESEDRLHVYLKKLPVKKEFSIEIPNKKGKGNRQVKKKLKGRFKNKEGKLTRVAELKLQYSPVHIILHSGHRDRADIDLKITAIRVFEERKEMEEGEYPLEWILLTSLEVQSNDIAELIVDFYNKRWTIETFFKTLKSGCLVEDCRLETYDRLVRYMTLFAIIAWRIYWMTFVNRVNPEEDCNSVLSDIEWKSLYCKIHKTRVLPKEIPKVRDVVIWIARLGGFLARKNDGDPGNTVIWRGWQRLIDLSSMWEIMSDT